MSEKGWSNWNQEIKEKKLSSTTKETYSLFLKGKTIQEICKLREYKQDTIERQIIELITKSYINVKDVISNSSEILEVIEKQGTGLSDVKSEINSASWFEIKCTIASINAKPKTKNG